MVKEASLAFEMDGTHLDGLGALCIRGGGLEVFAATEGEEDGADEEGGNCLVVS